jgi:hypothetical protein
MDVYPRHRSFAGPLILIAVGLVILLSNIGVVETSTWELISRYWPVILIILGLDNLVRGEGFAGPFLTIGIGSLFLFSNLEIIDLDIWQIILQFWPVLIIAVGLDIIFHREIQTRSIFAPLLGLILVVALVGGIIWFSGSQSPNLAEEQVMQSAEGVNDANLQFNAVAGVLKLNTINDPAVLLKGTVRLSRTEELVREGEVESGTAIVNLKSEGFALLPTFSWKANPAWDLSVNDQIPTRLVVDVALGENNLNLRSADLTALEVSTVMGKTVVVLPQSGNYQADLSGIMGEVIVIVPTGVSIEIELDSLLTSVSIPEGYTREGDWVRSPTAGADPSASVKVSQLIGAIHIQELK